MAVSYKYRSWSNGDKEEYEVMNSGLFKKKIITLMIEMQDNGVPPNEISERTAILTRKYANLIADGKEKSIYNELKKISKQPNKENENE